MDKKHQKFPVVPFLVLCLEIVFFSLLLTGSGFIKSNPEIKTTESGIQSTGTFQWENYRVIAHALGGLDGYAYLNSRESFIASYHKGYRLFEVDLRKTSDGIWVCRHNWTNPMGQWEGESEQVLSAEEFSSAKLYGTYTPMTLEDLFLLLKEYPDAFVLLDCKEYSVRNYQKTVQDYAEYRKLAREAGVGEVLDQLIPEIYNEAMYSGIALLHEFPSYIYSLWQEYSEAELQEIAVFCRKKNIPAVTVSKRYWSDSVQQIFDEQEILVYVYTVNDTEQAGNYINSGVAGVCTDLLMDHHLPGSSDNVEKDRKTTIK